MYPILSAPNPRSRGGADPGGPAGEDGAILLLVLWVLALLSVVVLSWAQEWRTEIRLAANFREDRQCHGLAEAGIYYALAKMMDAKFAEMQSEVSQVQSPSTVLSWSGDQKPQVLEIPGGLVEVRVADEAGKINLNRAEGKTLANLFMALGIPEAQWRVMVDSIEDWRQEGLQPRPFGAKSDYYLGLEPPYPAKGGMFDTVEELAWVRGFAGSSLPARLSAYLTVQAGARQINLNAAPLEVLLALELPPELAGALVQEREVAPLRPAAVMPRLASDRQLLPVLQNISFRSSPFFTIMATGMINNKGGARHTIKAMVRLSLRGNPPWRFVYWADDYPG